MSGFTFRGSFSKAIQWKPFADTVLFKLKLIAGGNTMKMNQTPASGVTVMVQCNPDTIHISAGDLRLVVFDLSNNKRFFAARRKDPNGNDYVEFTETLVNVGDRSSWTNGTDLACSVFPGYAGVMISGVYYTFYDPTNIGDQLTAACAFSNASGAAVVRGILPTGGYRFSVIVFGKSKFYGDNPTEEGVRSRVVFSAPDQTIWNSVVFNRNTTKARVRLTVIENSGGIKEYIGILNKEGDYDFTGTWIHQTSIPVRTVGQWRYRSTTPGAIDVDTSYQDTVSGTIYDPPLLCDTLGKVTTPKAFGGNNFNERKQVNGVATETVTPPPNITVIDIADVTVTLTSAVNESFTYGVYGTPWEIGTSGQFFNRVYTQHYTCSGYAWLGGYESGDSTIFATEVVSTDYEPYTKIFFADAYVRIVEKSLTTRSSYSMSGDGSHLTLSASRTSTTQSSYQLIVGNTVVYNEDSNMINQSNSYTYVSNHSPLSDPSVVMGEMLALTNAAPSTPYSETFDVHSGIATPALGDWYVYSNDLYAVRWLSSYGSGTVAHPNKIFFLPIDNGVIQPRIIGEYNYHAISGQPWGVRLAIHSE